MEKAVAERPKAQRGMVEVGAVVKSNVQETNIVDDGCRDGGDKKEDAGGEEEKDSDPEC